MERIGSTVPKCQEGMPGPGAYDYHQALLSKSKEMGSTYDVVHAVRPDTAVLDAADLAPSSWHLPPGTFLLAPSS